MEIHLVLVNCSVLPCQVEREINKMFLEKGGINSLNIFPRNVS